MTHINDLINIIREEGMKNYQPSFFIAKVTKGYPQTELLFNDIILKSQQIEYSSWMKIQAEGVKIAGSNHSHSLNFGGLNKGDDVLIFKLNDSKVLILDKVVR